MRLFWGFSNTVLRPRERKTTVEFLAWTKDNGCRPKSCSGPIWLSLLWFSPVLSLDSCRNTIKMWRCIPLLQRLTPFWEPQYFSFIVQEMNGWGKNWALCTVLSVKNKLTLLLCIFWVIFGDFIPLYLVTLFVMMPLKSKWHFTTKRWGDQLFNLMPVVQDQDVQTSEYSNYLQEIDAQIENLLSAKRTVKAMDGTNL